jgi:hypothetical protein
MLRPNVNQSKGPQIFQKSRLNFEGLDAGRVICHRFHTEDPRILGTVTGIQNSVAKATQDLGFVHV